MFKKSIAAGVISLILGIVRARTFLHYLFRLGYAYLARRDLLLAWPLIGVLAGVLGVLYGIGSLRERDSGFSDGIELPEDGPGFPLIAVAILVSVAGICLNVPDAFVSLRILHLY